jgi:hypothetical protein
MSKTTSSRLTAFRGQEAGTRVDSTKPTPPPPPLDLNAVEGCEYGHYPWDGWYAHAVASGLHARVAATGRLVIREAYQHDWSASLKAACGWRDDGAAMLAFALADPPEALRRWDTLLRTDGLRGDYPRRNASWTYGVLKPDARRLRKILAASPSNLHAPRRWHW